MPLTNIYPSVLSSKLILRSVSRSLRKLLQASATGMCATVIVTLPAKSAETIYFDYGLLGRSLPVSSLETFAQAGIVDKHLEPFFRAVPIDKRQQFQQVLTTPIDELNLNVPQQFTEPFVLSQWLYSPIGESALVRMGELIQTAGRLNGQYAIRSAIILAAADPEGLSLLNMIRVYGPIVGNLRPGAIMTLKAFIYKTFRNYILAEVTSKKWLDF